MPLPSPSPLNSHIWYFYTPPENFENLLVIGVFLTLEGVLVIDPLLFDF